MTQFFAVCGACIGVVYAALVVAHSWAKEQEGYRTNDALGAGFGFGAWFENGEGLGNGSERWVGGRLRNGAANSPPWNRRGGAKRRGGRFRINSRATTPPFGHPSCSRRGVVDPQTRKPANPQTRKPANPQTRKP